MESPVAYLPAHCGAHAPLAAKTARAAPWAAVGAAPCAPALPSSSPAKRRRCAPKALAHFPELKSPAVPAAPAQQPLGSLSPSLAGSGFAEMCGCVRVPGLATPEWAPPQLADAEMELLSPSAVPLQPLLWW
eukprot:m51a1_g9835 hypothetical protein (132) ;mRNA; f:1935244-1935778